MPKPNLIRVRVIKCLLCYDLFQIIDKFNHGKRRPCPCRSGEPAQHWPCPCFAEIETEGAEAEEKANDLDQDAPLSRTPYETQNSHDALMDYFLMGAGRSLAKLHQKYTEIIQNPPTLHIAELKNWSTRHRWRARVAQQNANDNAIEAEVGKDDFTKLTL